MVNFRDPSRWLLVTSNWEIKRSRIESPGSFFFMAPIMGGRNKNSPGLMSARCGCWERWMSVLFWVPSFNHDLFGVLKYDGEKTPNNICFCDVQRNIAKTEQRRSWWAGLWKPICVISIFETRFRKRKFETHASLHYISKHINSQCMVYLPTFG